MNWRARLIARVLLFTIPLFLSCEDEFNTLGFRRSAPFNLKYIEIPLNSSTIVDDTIPSFNLKTGTSTDRLLAGTYTDPVFGSVTATPYFDYIPSDGQPSFDPSIAVLDSVVLKLGFDFYTYGHNTTNPITFSIHELNEEIDETKVYNVSSSLPYDPSPVSTNSISIDPEKWSDLYDKIQIGLDTTITADFRLNQDFAERLYDNASANDSTYFYPYYFLQEFNGFAVVPESGDKAVGFSITSPKSRLVMYFHTPEDTLELNYEIFTSFNGVELDRSGTEVADIENQDPGEPMRYIQGSGGIMTAFDLTPFLNFSDTISNLLINSAELVIDHPEDGLEFTPPRGLWLKMLNDQNEFSTDADEQDSIARLSFSSTIFPYTYDDVSRIPSYFFMAEDYLNISDVRILSVIYSGDLEKYSGFMTLFLQQLYQADDDKKITRFAIYNPEALLGKTVDRVSFNKDNLKLRIYYTVPRTTSE